MNRSKTRIVATLSLAAVVTVRLVAQPVAAIHELVGCGAESQLHQLFLFLHQVSLLLFAVGGILAAVSLSYAGVMVMYGSEDAKRRAIERVKRVMLGVGLLWTAPFIIAFLLVPLNICSGGV